MNKADGASRPEGRGGRDAAFLLRALQGALIGLGAVLPGVSGGVLCVIFGVYQPVMEVFSDPVRALKRHGRLLLPVGLGAAAGFLGIARLLGYVLGRYPDASVCVFVGLIAGMLPALWREAGEQGRGRAACIAMGGAFAGVLVLLALLRRLSLAIAPGVGAWLLCGFCLALSVIAPGLSFSTLLMPLNLYAPFVEGIGRLDAAVLVPAGLSAALTILLLARGIDRLIARHHSVTFHAITGVVIAATLAIIPFSGFTSGAGAALANGGCVAAGALTAQLLGRMGAAAARSARGQEEPQREKEIP